MTGKMKFFCIEYISPETNRWTPFCTTRFDTAHDAWQHISILPVNREFRVVELSILNINEDNPI